MSSQQQGSQLAVALYRAILSAARSTPSPLRLRLPLYRSKVQWPPQRSPQFEMLPNQSAARELFPLLEPTELLDSPAGIEASDLRALIRDEFRKAIAAPPSPEHDAVGLGLEALKTMHEQVQLAKCSSFTRTEEPETGAAVMIEAASMHLGRDGPLHIFTYRLRLYNVGNVPVQVVGRSWEIKNADGSVFASVPRGSPGLVGETPRLQPGGTAFEYASGTSLQTPGGTVQGSLQMMALEPGAERPFDAEVGTFHCIVDEAAR
jgi:ApaG protein